jgi:uncharacterized protein (TIGR02145 family)
MKKIILIPLLILVNTFVFSQIGMGTNSPNQKAVLDLTSTTKGFLPPRMTNIQKTAIVTPPAGLMLWCSDCGLNGEMQAYNGVSWIILSGAISPTLMPTVTYGSDFLNFRNGWVGGVYNNGESTGISASHTTGQAFSTNATCLGKQVSYSNSCPTTVTVGSNVYNTVSINGQCWMKDNLREIPSNYATVNNAAWTTNDPVDLGYWGFRNIATPNGTAGFLATEPTNAGGHEGMMYQWSAAMNGSTTERAQGVCPTGWHIPSDCEVMYLEHGLGMEVTEQQVIQESYFRGSEVGSGLVAPKLRYKGADISAFMYNASGFTGLQTGNRTGAGFSNPTLFIILTSTQTNSSSFVIRYTGPEQGGIIRVADLKASAWPVRCLKDE